MAAKIAKTAGRISGGRRSKAIPKLFYRAWTAGGPELCRKTTMRSFPLLCLLVLLCSWSVAQLPPGQYVELKAEQFEEDGDKYIGISPRVKQGMGGRQGETLARYRRRFDYLLQNRTRFRNLYEPLFPDTARINALYIAGLVADSAFMSYWNAMTGPFTGQGVTREKFTVNEMMQVAATFFYCDAVRDDSTVSSHVCIVLNGAGQLRSGRDYTALEAFCFEAIFSSYDAPGGKPPGFVENFLQYIAAAVEQEKTFFLNKEDYLLKVRQLCFARMEQDASLRQALLGYYADHRDTFSFMIE
ncbi:MAG: hypothetical protein ABW019_06985 [Chitinophagaceae bacterium]